MPRHRRMADPSFRRQQWEDRYAPHVEPINRLVDRLREERGDRIPYMAPHYGGTEAEVLFIFQDPGPGTDDSRDGSGFLSCENDDPSAQLLAECMEAAGLSPSRVVAWNAYPWALPPGQSSPSSNDLTEGLDPLQQLLEALPKLKVVAPMGKVAHEAWKRFRKRYPKLGYRYKVLPGLHTSGRGITNGGQHTKAEGVTKVVDLMREAAAFVGEHAESPVRSPGSAVPG